MTDIGGNLLYQDAEKVHQRRSRIAQSSTYRSVRLASSLAAALLDGLFDHPDLM
jgi:hypothetical protein